uniref:Uncharacterized protein n=1 Tax=Caenorhabditis japonica TaxID=281687 RepID=A0A8R1ETA3_CAEJA
MNRDYANRLKEDSLRNAAWFVAVLAVLGIALFAFFVTFCCTNRQRQDKFVGQTILCLDWEIKRKFW